MLLELQKDKDNCFTPFQMEESETFARLQQCSANNWAHAGGIDPLVSTAVIEWSDTLPSSIIITTHRDHTVVLVGTAHGEMIKVDHEFL